MANIGNHWDNVGPGGDAGLSGGRDYPPQGSVPLPSEAPRGRRSRSRSPPRRDREPPRRRSRSRSRSRERPTAKPCKRLYVGNLDWNVKSEDLRALFQQYGGIEDSHVAQDRESGRSRGFGFVTLETEEQAIKAKEALEGHEMGGRKLHLDFARPRDDAPARGDRGGDRGDRGRPPRRDRSPPRFDRDRPPPRYDDRYGPPPFDPYGYPPPPPRGFDPRFDRAPFPDDRGFPPGGFPPYPPYPPMPYGAPARGGPPPRDNGRFDDRDRDRDRDRDSRDNRDRRRF